MLKRLYQAIRSLERALNGKRWKSEDIKGISKVSSFGLSSPMFKSERDIPIVAGPGGRSSTTGRIVTVFGCTGFLGRYIVHILAKKGNTIIIPFRGDEDEFAHLKPMGDLGQIIPLRFDLESPKEILECIKDSHAVINCIGKDYDTLRFPMEAVNVDGALRISRACRLAHVPRFIHISSMRASQRAHSQFLQLKAQAELEVKQEYPDVTIVRPSVLYGNEDRFINAYGSKSFLYPRLIMDLVLASFKFGIPVVKGHEHTKFYPLYVADAAYGVMQLLKDDQSIGKTYQFHGPVAYDMETFTDLFGRMTLRPTNLWPMSISFFRALGLIATEWKRALYKRDQIKQTMSEEIIDTKHPTIYDVPGMRKVSLLEDKALEFMRSYRHSDDYGTPPLPAHHRQSAPLRRES